MSDKCPRCGGTEFKEVDCGPDSREDDISYTSEICKSCGLWHDGWIDKWLIDCEHWQDAGTCEEYKP
jgi:hypothetical protein